MFTDDKALGEVSASPDHAARACADAAAYLRRYGHNKHSLGYLRSPVCALGALNASLYGDPRSNEAREISTECAAVRRMGFASHLALLNWNNAPERTAAEVIARFEEAAR